MTILPKGGHNDNNQEEEQNLLRHNCGLISTQLIIQDVASESNSDAPLSYKEDTSKFYQSHGNLHGPTSNSDENPSTITVNNGRKCLTYSRPSSKRKSTESIIGHCSSKTNAPPNLSYHDETVKERNNSEDEYEPIEMSTDEWEIRDKHFQELMRKKGLIVKAIEQDGACLFRAIADQVYGDEDAHELVRQHCMNYILQNRDFFSEYLTEDIERYVNRKRNLFVQGNHLEIQALSEMYNRTIEVYCYSEEPINIFHGQYKNGNEPIRLSYERGSHYNSLRDPYTASIGVGLGLPNHQPGEADKKLLKEAKNASELVLIEQTMIKDKISVTDWEATNDAMLEQVAHESWAQYVNNLSMHNSVASCSDNTLSSSSTSHRKLLKEAAPTNERILIEQTMIKDKMAAIDWEATNDAIVEQVARESWAQYMNELNSRTSKASCSTNTPSSTSTSRFNVSPCSSLTACKQWETNKTPAVNTKTNLSTAKKLKSSTNSLPASPQLSPRSPKPSSWPTSPRTRNTPSPNSLYCSVVSIRSISPSNITTDSRLTSFNNV